jgi:hypothetical protein
VPVSGLGGLWPGRMIRIGVVAVFAGLVACALVFDDGNLIWVVLAAGLVGAGFGVSWSFISQRVLADLTGDERAIGGAGMATVRLTGLAAGSALAAAIANLAGFSHGFSVEAARSAGIWVFAGGLPLAALACVAAWRLGASGESH